MTIELRGCPAHRGVTGNGKTDGWAELAADGPDAHGMELIKCSGRSVLHSPVRTAVVLLCNMSRNCTR